jgi:spore germination cell wall hydrolase CwlJ-like protein
MGLWGFAYVRACVLVLGFIVIIQPARAEERGEQSSNSQPSLAAAILQAVESTGIEAAAASAPTAPFEKPVDSELKCLTDAIYFEARGESVEGQLAVGRVVLNRLASGKYRDTVCGVVYQGTNRGRRCQFSFACDNKPDVIAEPAKWQEIEGYAAWLFADEESLRDQHQPLTAIAASTYYHADYVSPRWARRLVPTGHIGRHYFYCDPAA